MREEGLVEIENLSGLFLEGFSSDSTGAIATAVYEGTRPLLLEIQALTARANAAFARRSAIGIDLPRLNMIIAVLGRKARLSLWSRMCQRRRRAEAGGTSSDLACALAIWSIETGITIPSNILALGEIGLTGELRPVQHAEKLVREAERMGFERVLLPVRNAEKLSRASGSIELLGIAKVSEAISVLGGRWE